MTGVDPGILHEWLCARSLSRGLPVPVHDHGGLRVDSGQPAELRRYVFAAPTPGLSALAATITVPHILIKLCAPLDELLALLPPGWRGHPQSCFMTHDGPMLGGARTVLPQYTLKIERDGAAWQARVTTVDGSCVASGRAVRHERLLVYDQIVTDPGHRRRGLAEHVMRSLETAGGGSALQALTATSDGHELYAALGWKVISLYSTAEFGGPMEKGKAAR